MSNIPAPQELDTKRGPEFAGQAIGDPQNNLLNPANDNGLSPDIAENVRRITGVGKDVETESKPQMPLSERIRSAKSRLSRKGAALATATTVALGAASPAIAAAEQGTNTTGTSTLSQAPASTNQETTTNQGTTTTPEAKESASKKTEEQKISALNGSVKSFLAAEEKANQLDDIADRPGATTEDIDNAAQAAKDANAEQTKFRTVAGEAKEIKNNELVQASVDYIEAVRAENAAIKKANSADATPEDKAAYKKAEQTTDAAYAELKKITATEEADEQIQGGAQAPEETSSDESAKEQTAQAKIEKLRAEYDNAKTQEDKDAKFAELQKLLAAEQKKQEQGDTSGSGDDATEEKVNPDHFNNVWTGDEKNGLIGKFEINRNAPVQSKENFFKELRHNPKALAFWVTCLENGGSYEACVEKPGVLEKAEERVKKYANMSPERKSKVYERLMKKFDAMKYGGVKEHNGPYKTVAATTDGGFAPAENTRYNDDWLQFIQDDGTVIYIRACDQIVKNIPVAPRSLSTTNVVYTPSGVQNIVKVNAPSGSGGGTSQENVDAPAGTQVKPKKNVPAKNPNNKNGRGNSQVEADGDRGTDDVAGSAPAQSGTSPNTVPAQQQQQEPAPVRPVEGDEPPTSGNEQTGNVGAQPAEPAAPAAGTADPAPAIGSKPGATTSSLRAKISNIKSAAKDKVYGVEGVQ